MSVNLMSAIFETEFFDLKDENGNVTKASTAKLVLLAMADHANDEGEGAYPSIERLCRKTALSPQTIRNTFDALRHNGIISLTGLSKYGTNNHTINTECFPKAIGKEVTVLTLYPLEGSNQSPLPLQPVTFTPLPVIPESSLTTNKTHKKGDLLDGMIHYGKQAVEQGADKVEEVIRELERGLRVNITRSTNNQQVAKRIIKDGRPVSQWLSWAMADEWRASHLYLYADLEKVWRDFPQAFGTEGFNPQGLQVGF